ncbi:MAG: hypothetical protein JO346_10305 [Alphaproteobacteria bacterium]|nr:hypothetical protein [Alphaproteobacteria bacterium]
MCVVGGAASAEHIDLSKLETKDVRVLYYDPIQTYLTPYVAQAFENSFAFQQKTFDWTPWDKTTVYLRDLSDNGAAAVRATPTNALTIDIAPIATTFETFSPGERFFTLMNHELVHVATLDAWNETDRGWRDFFHGKPQPVAAHPETILYSYLAQPRTNVPRWYLEGTAVFMETWMGGGLGRAQGGYDEMVFRAMVRDNAHFYDALGLESEGTFVDFQIGANAYLYGTRFVSYLALIYGPEKVVEWMKRGPDSKAYYANQFEYVFGKPLDAAWNDWIQWEHDFQKKNLASVAQYPLTPVTPLTKAPLGSVSRSFYDPQTNSLIAGFRDLGAIANVSAVSLSDNSVRRLAILKGPALYRATSLAYDPDARQAYYTTDNNAFRDLMVVDVATGDSRMLLEDARIGDIAFNRADKSIWGIRHLNGLDTLVRIKPTHDGWNQVITFPYGHVLSDLDISPDGTLLSASVGEVSGEQRLEVYRIDELLAGNARSIATLSLGTSIPEGGAFSADGRYVYATAYYTGVSNVYRLDVTNNTYDAVSNAETGLFRPVPMPDGSLIAFEYTGQGLLPVKLDPKPLNDLGNIKFLGAEVAAQHPIVKDWAVGPPSRIPLEQLITDRGFYKPEDELAFDGMYPIVAGYKGHLALGWHFQFEDPLQYDLLQANISVSPAGNITGGEWFHADVSYSDLYWRLKYWHNDADFYDLFGPVDRSRKGDAVSIGYHEVLIWDLPRRLDMTAEAAFYSGLDTLPGAQNVASGASSLGTAKIEFTFTNTQTSIGAIDNEAGYRANGTFKVDYQRERLFPHIYGGFDFGTTLPWAHTSAWLYTSAGLSAGTKTSPLDYFYFGSFGNNYVDVREVKRYREYDSLPGFDIDEISARSFVKSVAELNLPPIRFADIGTPYVYLSSIRPAAFGGVLEADPGMTTARTLETVGFQVDFNFTVAVHLPMTFSVGYAHGFGDGIGGGHEEIMASLKIL